MDWSEAKLRCKKHPEHSIQLPGVCSSCLSERLTNLTSSAPLFSSSSSFTTSQNKPPVHHQNSSFSPISLSNCSNSSSSSAFGSPPAVHGRQHDPMTKYSDHATKSGSDNNNDTGSRTTGLRKSRSLIAFASRKSRSLMKKKGGFWSKLMPSTSKRAKGSVLLLSKSTSVTNR